MSIKLHHIGLACEQIENVSQPLSNVLNLLFDKKEAVPGQHVNVCFSNNIENTSIELIEATQENSARFPNFPHPIKNFLKNKTSAIHHLCFSVSNLEDTLNSLEKKGIRSLFGVERGHNHKKIAFIEPSQTGEILIELMEE